MNHSATLRRLPAWPNESLADTMNRHSTDLFYTECNGGDGPRKLSDEVVVTNYTSAPTCGKCHVVVSDPWYTYMKPKIHPMETSLIEKKVSDIHPTSRMACCIRMEPWMNEMIVRHVYDPELDDGKETVSSAVGSPGVTQHSY
jgi:hypothetical protein